ncbi:unnamed protein product [Dracunculus medinensis]|uniref:Sulfhydryl oxidase n=1 Tax=Dracunculus medinensis TaxID=318479 RepID=A0A0N4UHZ1_DRAME|nr:unnamed protein product [Dracunculus medinensis]
MSSSERWNKENCRACLSVEELMKKARELRLRKLRIGASGDATSLSSAENDALEGRTIREDCPLNTDQLGRSTWDFLHTMAAYYPERPSEVHKANAKSFMFLLGKIYPCHHCAEDLRRDLENKPPEVDSKEEFSLWMCELHNRVNKKLGKPIFNCSLWKERWLDGWKDGSCDY